MRSRLRIFTILFDISFHSWILMRISTQVWFYWKSLMCLILYHHSEGIYQNKCSLTSWQYFVRVVLHQLSIHTFAVERKTKLVVTEASFQLCGCDVRNGIITLLSRHALPIFQPKSQSVTILPENADSDSLHKSYM